MSGDTHAEGGGEEKGGKKLWWAALGALAVLFLILAYLWPEAARGIRQGATDLAVGAAVADSQRNTLIAFAIGLALLLGAVFGVIGAVLNAREKKKEAAGGGGGAH